MWRAIRHGLDGRLLDLEAPIIGEFPAEETLDRLNAWTGADIVLPERNGAQRQRALIEAGAGAGGGVRRVRAGNPVHVLTGDRAMTQPEFTEEELRRLEAEMERITVDDVLIQTTVTLLNLAARKAGLAAPPGQGPAPDWEQVRQAIEGARALMPLLEARHGDQLGQVRQTLSQLQMIYAQQAGGAAPAAEGAARARAGSRQDRRRPAPEPEGPGPAQSSGRLWIPGQ